ncbi:MAG: general secretion pathway protein GspB [Rhodoferax sp.]|nr:general secretion pathway protein GspB [Rhodoferax sp.]
MSYILEALKRADAERQRGAVPGLLASQVTTPLAGAASSGYKHLRWAAVTALVLGGMAVGLWRWHVPARASARLVQTGSAPTSMPVVAAGLPSATVAGSAQPSVATPSQPTAVPAVAAPQSVATRPKPAAHAPPPIAATPPVAPVEPVAMAAVSPASASQAASAGVALLGELQEDIRRQIPALSITGVVHSANPAQRLLVVNNQVLTQGSLAAPELRLEEIENKSSVFSFRGTRFRVAH